VSTKGYEPGGRGFNSCRARQIFNGLGVLLLARFSFCATFARLFPIDHPVLLRHHSQQRRFLRFQYRVRRAYQLREFRRAVMAGDVTGLVPEQHLARLQRVGGEILGSGDRNRKHATAVRAPTVVSDGSERRAGTSGSFGRGDAADAPMNATCVVVILELG